MSGPQPQPRTHVPYPERFAVSLDEAAEMLGLGVTKTRELMLAGELERFTFDRAVRVTVESVRRYFEAHRRDGQASVTPFGKVDGAPEGAARRAGREPPGGVRRADSASPTLGEAPSAASGGVLRVH
jgi:hypothetical protein